jgi:L-threonylcarbamoyladenylate synthase
MNASGAFNSGLTESVAMRILQVNPISPDREVIAAAADRVRRGGVIAFPTTSLYGLGVDPFNGDAVDRLFKVKGRDRGNPILLLLSDKADLEDLTAEIPSSAMAIIEKYWPGSVTVVLKAKPTVPDTLTAGSGKIGVRLPGHPVAAALTRALGFPLTGTSANLSGQKGAAAVSELDPILVKGLDLILDAGPLKGGLGSTVIDATVDPVDILREGAVRAADLLC